jgi:GntR family transcriptional regulator
MIHNSTGLGSQLTLNLRSKQPIGEQIYLQMRRLIEEKQLRAGDQLPPVRELADLLKVNFNTVARAYRQLDQLGLISTQQGRGSYVLESPAQPEAAFSIQSFLERLERFLRAEAQHSGIDTQQLWEIGFAQQEELHSHTHKRGHRKKVSHRPGWRAYSIPTILDFKTSQRRKQGKPKQITR